MERVAVLVGVLLAASAVVFAWAAVRVASRADELTEQRRGASPVPRWVYDASEDPWLPPPQ